MFPAPMAKPSTMAMTGFGMSRISDWKSTSAEPWYSSVLRSSPWSRPDEKAFGPDPEMITTLNPVVIVGVLESDRHLVGGPAPHGVVYLGPVDRQPGDAVGLLVDYVGELQDWPPRFSGR